MSLIKKSFAALAGCAAIVESAALVAMLVTTGAMAEAPPPPKLSGTYIVTGTVVCQPGTTGAKGGAYDANIGLITFYPTLGVIALRQTQVFGSVTDQSVPFAVLNKTYDFTYSNTAATLTLNNTAYDVFYSEVENNIVGAVSGVAVDANGCARSFTMHLAA